MDSIVITVAGKELGNLQVELTSEEVASLYKLRHDNNVRIVEMEKKLKDLEINLTYIQEGRAVAENELCQANTLLTALGVAEKTSEDEAYYCKPLTVTTRIALYIAQVRSL
jgi:hypothetical protein